MQLAAAYHEYQCHSELAGLLAAQLTMLTESISKGQLAAFSGYSGEMLLTVFME